MANTQRFALSLGIAYILIGVLGFIPALVTYPATFHESNSYLEVVSGYGYLMGLFPVNSALNIIHIATGVIGIVASIALDSSRLFSGQIGIYYTALAILGLVPFAKTFFGLFPLFGYEVLLHGLTGLLGTYFGFFVTPSLRKLFRRELKEDAVAGEVLNSD
ncbi:MAG: DUF4383 domain-containing protein [Leptolyngbyaceae cyanobacterium SM2_3_12]|nr:DUF4383 domain-containing protein [Leptolyngbyaceae cyanobacterium SM2_3_12]